MFYNFTDDGITYINLFHVSGSLNDWSIHSIGVANQPVRIEKLE